MSDDGVVRLVPATEAAEDERRAATLALLEEAAAEVAQGMWTGVMIVLENDDAVEARWSPTPSRLVRVGHLEVLKHRYVDHDEDDEE